MMLARRPRPRRAQGFRCKRISPLRPATRTLAVSRTNGRFRAKFRPLSLACHPRDSRCPRTKLHSIPHAGSRMPRLADLEYHGLPSNLLHPAALAAQINFAHGMQEVRGSTPLGSTISFQIFRQWLEWVTRQSTVSEGSCHRFACSPLSPSCHLVGGRGGP